MAYRLASVIAVWLFASPVAAGYSFSISASADNPDSVQSVPGGPRLLYLWLHCGDDGLSAFEGALLTNLEVFGFTPAAGIVNAGSGTSLLLGLGACPEAPTVLGNWSVLDTGGHACLGPVVTAVDCASPNPAATLMPKVTGFSSTSDLPCEVGSKPCSAEAGGFVLGYGSAIAPPYEFSGVGGDTLRLNGLPYYPQRPAAPQSALVPSPEVEAFTDASKQLYDAALAAAHGLSDPLSRANAMASVYAASPMTASVEVTTPRYRLVVVWATGPLQGQWAHVNTDPPQPPQARAAGDEDQGLFHATLVEQFETITAVDGFILFGSDYFVVGGSAGTSAAMRRALRKLSRNEPAGAAVEGTPLAQEPVLSDVLDRIRSSRVPR